MRNSIKNKERGTIDSYIIISGLGWLAAHGQSKTKKLIRN